MEYTPTTVVSGRTESGARSFDIGSFRYLCSASSLQVLQYLGKTIGYIGRIPNMSPMDVFRHEAEVIIEGVLDV